MLKLYSVLAIIFLMVSCSGSDDASNITDNYIAPTDDNDGISVASAFESDVNVELLAQMKADNLDGTYTNVHSILIAVDNILIFEEYFEGRPIYGFPRVWDKDELHLLHSVTKSFNSALVGIAIDEFGLSLEDSVKNFFPEMDTSQWSGLKSSITVEDLLPMTSGLEWDEWSYPYDDPRNDHTSLTNSSYWPHYVLEKPLVSTPGTQFIYNSGVSIVLGEIVRRQSGVVIKDFAIANLFEPLGIDQFEWGQGNGRVYQTGGGLSLRPRDMIKFGLLFLKNGMWEGNQVVSEDWVHLSTSQHGPNVNYGYQWWLSEYILPGKRFDAYYAGGRGGQYIIVIDELNLVVVFTAGNDNTLAFTQTKDMLIKYILPSILN